MLTLKPCEKSVGSDMKEIIQVNSLSFAMKAQHKREDLEYEFSIEI